MLRLAACLLAGIAFAAPAAAQTLRFGMMEDPDALDPTLARTFASRMVFAALCDKLVDIGPDLKPVPQLATSWEPVARREGAHHDTCGRACCSTTARSSTRRRRSTASSAT